MGAHRRNNMKFLLFVTLATFATLAAPAPTDLVMAETEALVPETALLEDVSQKSIIQFQSATSSPYEAAKKAYKFLQQAGTDDNACRALAQSMITEVNSIVNTTNSNLAALDLGAGCPATYQTEVDASNLALEQATANRQEADARFQNASNTLVTIVKTYIVAPTLDYF